MDNGVVVLDMKSRNNANSPHSPAVTMTTEPPEVGGKSQEMEAEGRRGEAGQEGCMRPVFLFIYLFFTPQFGRSSIYSYDAQPRRPNTVLRRHPTSPGRWRSSI